MWAPLSLYFLCITNGRDLLSFFLSLTLTYFVTLGKSLSLSLNFSYLPSRVCHMTWVFLFPRSRGIS